MEKPISCKIAIHSLLKSHGNGHSLKAASLKLYKAFEGQHLPRFEIIALIASHCLVTTDKSQHGNGDNSRARNNIFSKTFQLNDHHDPLYQQGIQTHFP